MKKFIFAAAMCGFTWYIFENQSQVNAIMLIAGVFGYCIGLLEERLDRHDQFLSDIRYAIRDQLRASRDLED